ncbi:mannitol-1-phosphate 5-dehydrogenase [Microbacterium faecale]|uniref:Mannitol-1-phosphate 5-dehydrogenase n=1 Tax=Microbacterium faecale TaxID=1804630 RepID=A0A917DCE0_9MICO|nr:mannitol dehydrogenase family protein [Microbacterium faecale]GGD26221.1 mannitol-1-phosphate 5-dehydrogenase [Microbacterium faecale]
MTRLTRVAAGLGSAPPVRIVHLGLGAFHRSHQAWFTARAGDDWGIAAFTGRSPAAAVPLAEQNGLFTLVERGPDGDSAEIIGSIARAHDGRDLEALAAAIAAPTTAIVTLTITEAGYLLGPDGRLDGSDDAVIADRAALRAATRDPVRAPRPSTALGRLAMALEARRRAGAGPIAVVPCDNLPGNGRVVREALLGLASDAPELRAYIEAEVSMVSTSVDRITPAATDDDHALAERLTGFVDHAPVVAEPFHDWVLAGEFPAGRPAWERAGARFVDDIEPFENRKLWMLNGAHTILASVGPARGHETVASAMADATVRGLVERFWDEASRHLAPELEADNYRDALMARFLNPRIEHRLAQIAQGAGIKVRARILPVLQRELAAGRDASGCLAALAAWADAEGQGIDSSRLFARVSEDFTPVVERVDALRRRR